MENEEVIRRRMEQTRDALTEKLETLEHKLSSTVSAVTDTVASVQEKVHEGVESVKEAVDVQAHVERHPWLTLGGSVLCGFVLGNMLLGQRKKPAEPWRAPPRASEKSNGFARPAQEKPPAPPAQGHWFGALKPELQHLKSLALGATLGTVREMLTEQVPPHMADRLRDIIDAVTKKAGGEPMPSSEWAAAASTTSPSDEPEPSCPS